MKNNSDNIEKWLNYMDKNTNFDKTKIQQDLKISVLDNLIEVFSEYENISLSTINEVIYNFEHSSYSLSTEKKVKKETKLMILAFCDIILEVLYKIKKQFKNKDFDLFDYLTREKDMLLDEQDNNDEDYEDETEYESSDDESEDNYGDGDNDDDDDDDDDEVDYIIIDEKSNKRKNLIKEKDPKKRKLNNTFMNEVNKSKNNMNMNNNTIYKYYSDQNENDQKQILTNLKEINNHLSSNIPILFRIINLNVDIQTKKVILNNFMSINSSYGENNKQKTWLNNVLKIPFGQYKGIDLENLKTVKDYKLFLSNLTKDMDNAIYGHKNAKNSIIKLMGQKIRNPECKGGVLGIYGPPGNGKTTLIKEGIAKAMNKPFVFISLGGATDASFLEGHSYTYEGSIYGRIAEGIIQSKCMNPIIYFDELDKISRTSKGDEITNLLIHLIDPAQNNTFRDKYFHDLHIDLSKVTFMFSFNNISNINYILLDRITTIETKYLTSEQKQIIARDYLLPNILKDIGLSENSIKLNENLISLIIDNYTNEGGVRKLKSILYDICRELNVFNMTNTKVSNKKIKFPLNLTQNQLNKLLKDHYKYSPDIIHTEKQVGIVNGLWANNYGMGGILPIQSKLIPGKNILDIKATGSLEKVIKESVEVALSVAWQKIDDDCKQKWISKWKKHPECFHIHCPDGAISKDGPSAGGALTLVFYSQLTNILIDNNVAMTGEINLQGNITKIGGLEEKLVGAKKAGVSLALIPYDNLDDLSKIKVRVPNLFDNFEVKSVKHFDDVLNILNL